MSPKSIKPCLFGSIEVMFFGLLLKVLNFRSEPNKLQSLLLPRRRWRKKSARKDDSNEMLFSTSLPFLSPRFREVLEGETKKEVHGFTRIFVYHFWSKKKKGSSYNQYIIAIQPLTNQVIWRKKIKARIATMSFSFFSLDQVSQTRLGFFWNASDPKKNAKRNKVRHFSISRPSLTKWHAQTKKMARTKKDGSTLVSRCMFVVPSI